jgi:tetratricopeptide (TPR) repeat protein
MTAESPISVYSTQAIENAKEAEADGKLEEAAKFYEQVIKQNLVEDFPYDRLMIIYRKLKKYEEELRIINKGIKLYENFYKKSNRKNSSKQKQLVSLSDAFMKSAGLKDKKGNLLYLPEPLARWTKRKGMVEKKLK